MQMEVPGIVDVDKEADETKKLYGIGESETDRFGRRCFRALD